MSHLSYYNGNKRSFHFGMNNELKVGDCVTRNFKNALRVIKGKA